jgi:hypothetical protein
MAIVIKKCGGQCVSKVYQKYQHGFVSTYSTDRWWDGKGRVCVRGDRESVDVKRVYTTEYI